MYNVINSRLVLAVLLLPGLWLMAALSHGSVIAQAAITVHDLRFFSSDPQAELFWFEESPGDPFSGWRGDVVAQAQDSLSGTDADADEVFGDNESLRVEANTALAASVAEYQVVNGPEVAKGSGDVEIITGAGINIGDIDAQASALAAGSFDNFFFVTGGTPGTAVDVTFELDYIYRFEASADEDGFFLMSVFAQLLLEDLDDFAGDVDSLDFDTVDFDILPQIRFGTATGISELFEATLSVSATLAYDEEYFLFAEADSEVLGINIVPAPGVVWLFIIGLLPFSRRLVQSGTRMS